MKKFDGMFSQPYYIEHQWGPGMRKTNLAYFEHNRTLLNMDTAIFS